MTEPFKDPKHLANSADAMGRACKSWQSSTAQYHFAVRDTIRKQADDLEALQAENARLREAERKLNTLKLKWTVRDLTADDFVIIQEDNK